MITIRTKAARDANAAFRASMARAVKPHNTVDLCARALKAMEDAEDAHSVKLRLILDEEENWTIE